MVSGEQNEHLYDELRGLEKNCANVAARLNRCNSLVELHEALVGVSTALGFELFLFRMSVNLAGFQRKLVSINNYPREWMRYYRELNLYRIDPAVRHCRDHTTPLQWDEMHPPDDVDGTTYADFRQRARAAGLMTGISFPIHGPFGDWGLLSLNSSSSTHKLLPTALIVGKLISACLQDSSRRILWKQHGSPTHGSLTNREKECLAWAVEGKTAWEISRILGISERTVVYHMKNCTSKLKAANRIQAAARVMAYLTTDLAFLYDNPRPHQSVATGAGVR